MTAVYQYHKAIHKSRSPTQWTATTASLQYVVCCYIIYIRSDLAGHHFKSELVLEAALDWSVTHRVTDLSTAK